MRPWWACALLLLAAPAAAQRPDDWRPIIIADDLRRLETLPRDLEQAAAAVAARDYSGIAPAELRRILALRAAALDPRALPGTWRCRNVQVSSLGVFGYPPFECRIRAVANGWFFEKVSGSQRVSGMLFRDDGQRLVLLGGATVNNEPQRGYTGDDREHQVFGVLIMPARNRAVVLFSDAQRRLELYELTR